MPRSEPKQQHLLAVTAARSRSAVRLCSRANATASASQNALLTPHTHTSGCPQQACTFTCGALSLALQSSPTGLRAKAFCQPPQHQSAQPTLRCQPSRPRLVRVDRGPNLAPLKLSLPYRLLRSNLRTFVISLVEQANSIQSFSCKALPLQPRERPLRQESAEHSMRMSVQVGHVRVGPARGQELKL